MSQEVRKWLDVHYYGLAIAFIVAKDREDEHRIVDAWEEVRRLEEQALVESRAA